LVSLAHPGYVARMKQGPDKTDWGDARLLAAIEKRLTETTAEDAVVSKLQTYKGVGLITAVTLRAEIGRFDRFRSGKQLARFCGFSPRNASSGERVADAGLVLCHS